MRAIKNLLERGSQGFGTSEDRARWEMAVELVRSEPHARGIDGTEAGAEALLFGDGTVEIE